MKVITKVLDSLIIENTEVETNQNVTFANMQRYIRNLIANRLTEPTERVFNIGYIGFTRTPPLKHKDCILNILKFESEKQINLTTGKITYHIKGTCKAEDNEKDFVLCVLDNAKLAIFLIHKLRGKFLLKH